MIFTEWLKSSNCLRCVRQPVRLNLSRPKQDNYAHQHWQPAPGCAFHSLVHENAHGRGGGKIFLLETGARSKRIIEATVFGPVASHGGVLEQTTSRISLLCQQICMAHSAQQPVYYEWNKSQTRQI